LYIHHIRNAPRENLARIQANNYDQIHIAMFELDIRDISSPDLIRKPYRFIFQKGRGIFWFLFSGWEAVSLDILPVIPYDALSFALDFGLIPDVAAREQSCDTRRRNALEGQKRSPIAIAVFTRLAGFRRILQTASRYPQKLALAAD